MSNEVKDEGRVKLPQTSFMFYIFFRFLNFKGNTTSTPTSKLVRFFGKLLSSTNSMNEPLTQPPAKEKRTPRREIVLTGVVASLLLYISIWQLLDIITPTNRKALVYSTLAVLSAAVLFFLLEKYPKILG